jgi:hypothetical protein
MLSMVDCFSRRLCSCTDMLSFSSYTKSMDRTK